MLMSSSAENTFSFYTAMKQELERTREALVAAGAEKDWQRRAREPGSAEFHEAFALLTDNTLRLTRGQLLRVVASAAKRYSAAMVQPGEAVGAVGASGAPPQPG